MKKILFNCIVFSVVVASIGCSSKKMIVKSVPDKSLIISHKEADIDSSYFSTIQGEAPAEFKLAFMGKKDKYFVTAEKRGYQKETKMLDKLSESGLQFDLKKIDGVSEKITEYTKSPDNKFLLIPLGIDVVIHSGVGNLDKYTPSPEKSETVTREFFASLNTECIGNQNIAITPQWENLYADTLTTKQLKDILLKLNIARLPYYSYPPSVKNIAGNSPLLKQEIEGAGEGTYLVFVWGKCITETKGRIIGNVAATMGAAVVEGYGVATGRPIYYSDPTAFILDSGTRLVFYIVDAATMEILSIEPYTYGIDVAKEKQLPNLVKIISKYPSMDKK